MQLGFCPSTSLSRCNMKSEKEYGNKKFDKISTVIQNVLMLASSRDCKRKLSFSEMSSECLSNTASTMSPLTCKSALQLYAGLQFRIDAIYRFIF